MKRLLICNTYFQLIITLQLSLTLFKEDRITIIITDKTPNTEFPAKKLKELHVVDKVLYQQTNSYCGKKTTWRDKIQDIYNIVFGDSKFLALTSEDYDEIIYFNYDLFVMALFAELYKKNKKIICSRYEEGILSYNTKIPKYIKYRIGEFVRHILLKKSLFDKTKQIYLCYPELYEGKLKIVEIPKIKLDGPIGEILANMFNLKMKDLNYKNGYIFFSSVYDFEGGEPINEIEVARRIQDIVGNEALLVKVHPRDTRNIYQKNGFNVDCNSSIPWEAVQLNTDCSGITFISATSCSVLSINMLLDPMPRTFYVYPCCELEGNKFAVKTIENLKKLLSNAKFERIGRSVQVINSFDELYRVLRQNNK